MSDKQLGQQILVIESSWRITEFDVPMAEGEFRICVEARSAPPAAA